MFPHENYPKTDAPERYNHSPPKDAASAQIHILDGVIIYKFGYPSMERISDKMLSSRQLASMRSADIKTCVLPDLIDITRLQVNHNLPVYERINQFVSDVGNPYLYRVNDTIVKVQYSEQSISLQERLSRLIHG